MFKIVLLALVAYLGLGPVVGRPPDLAGLSTWYDPCTHHINVGDRERCEAGTHAMANGEAYQVDAATVAVDVSHRGDWLNKRAVVVTERGRLASARVTDTGLLYAAGAFRRGLFKTCNDGGCEAHLRYWPVDTAGVLWSDDEAYPVVADFPRDFFRSAISYAPDAVGGAETTIVWVWIVE